MSSSHRFSHLFSLSLCLFLFATAPPEAETAGFDEEEHEEQNNGEEKDQNIQAVILVPSEFMGMDPQVLGSFVSHGELYPEHRLVQRVHWPVVVDTG